MIRSAMKISLLLVLLLWLSPLLNAEELKFTFIGNEAFLITDGKTTLLTDYPYRSGYSGYMTYDFSKIQPQGEIVSLITHKHPDHFEEPLFAKTNWRIIAPNDVVTMVDRRQVVSGDKLFRFSNISVEAIETPHAKVNHNSYLVTWHGRRLYFVGDTESTDALLQMKNLDVAFVTPWLLQSVKKSGKPIDASRIVIYHHAPAETVPLCDRCKLPKQGETFTLN